MPISTQPFDLSVLEEQRSHSGSSSNSDDPSSSDSGSPSENISNADSVHSLCVESKDSSVI